MFAVSLEVLNSLENLVTNGREISMSSAEISVSSAEISVSSAEISVSSAEISASWLLTGLSHSQSGVGESC